MIDIFKRSFAFVIWIFSKPINFGNGFYISIMQILIGFALIGLLVWFVKGLLK